MTRDRIEAELLDWMGDADWRVDDERFERIALELFRFQFEHCAPYAALCRTLERTPDSIREAREIPAVPTGAFKEFELRCFDGSRTIRTFRTSGTSTDRRGALYLDRLDLYEASLLSSLRHALTGPGADDRPIASMRFLAASPDDQPESSLSYMFGALLEAERPRVEGGFDLRAEEIDWTSLRDAVTRAQRSDEAILIAGTAFAFVHFLEDAGDFEWRLPAGSRVMETGGFKGRSREVPREVLHAELAERFSIPPTHLLNQYGMTELGSQFYDSTLVDPIGPRRKLVPPWTRVRFVDPVGGQDVAEGEVGMILIQDLANTGSIAAIQTADLGRAILDDGGRPIGFDVLGRAEGAEARGCSIATDIMLEASGGSTR